MIYFQFPAYLPGDVSLPTPPGFAEMLQDGTSFVLFDAFWHHVDDVVHHLKKFIKDNKSIRKLWYP